MLIIATRMRELNFNALMDIYLEANLEDGAARYPKLSSAEQLLLAEQDFYQYLVQCFFGIGNGTGLPAAGICLQAPARRTELAFPAWQYSCLFPCKPQKRSISAQPLQLRIPEDPRLCGLC